LRANDEPRIIVKLVGKMFKFCRMSSISDAVHVAVNNMTGDIGKSFLRFPNRVQESLLYKLYSFF
jgi:hypothetical protein